MFFLLRVIPSLDSRCSNSCIYCKKRCDVCMQLCSDEKYKAQNLVLGIVQCCSDVCYNSVFVGTEGVVIEKAQINALPKEHVELMSGYISIDLKQLGFKATLHFAIFCAREEYSDGSKYIQLWYHSIYKPLCIEYVIDNNFNPLCIHSSDQSEPVFTPEEEKESMLQYHNMLVESGVFYEYMKLFATS